MKKFVDPLSTAAGAPFFSNQMLLDVMQREYYAIMEGLLDKWAADDLIISGGRVTGGANKSITAGLCYIEGEYYRFDAASNLGADFYIYPMANNIIQKEWSDATERDTIIEKKATVNSNDPGGGTPKIYVSDNYNRYLRNAFADIWVLDYDWNDLAPINGWSIQSFGELKSRCKNGWIEVIGNDLDPLNRTSNIVAQVPGVPGNTFTLGKSESFVRDRKFTAYWYNGNTFVVARPGSVASSGGNFLVLTPPQSGAFDGVSFYAKYLLG